MKDECVVFGNGHLANYLIAQGAPNKLRWRQVRANPLGGEDVLAAAKRAVAAINCIAKTDLEWCEDNPREAWRSNVETPLMIYRALRPGVPFIHIGSGCIWATSDKARTPSCPPNPPSFYGWTKCAADALLLAEARRENPIYILRPRQLYSPLVCSRNTLDKMRRYTALISEPNSMTSAHTLYGAIRVCVCLGRVWPALAAQHLPPGIYNVADCGVISPLEVGVMLHEAGLRDAPRRLTRANLNSMQRVKRVSVVLDATRTTSMWTSPNIRDEIARVIREYASNLKKER